MKITLFTQLYCPQNLPLANFEMAEITITPVQATQAKSVIIQQIICCLKGYGE